MAANFKVIYFEPSFSGDNGTLSIEVSEEKNGVFYNTPVFRLSAGVEISIDNAERYEIGLIQICSSNDQRNYYGSDAIERWELPLPVNDSDDDSNIPWYNITPARTVIDGPTDPIIRSVNLNDGFRPLVNRWEGAKWNSNSRGYEGGVTTSPLYRIVRLQNFKVWLVAHRSGSPWFQEGNQPVNFTSLRYLEWIIPVDLSFHWKEDSSVPAGTPGHSKPDYSRWYQTLQPSFNLFQSLSPPPIPAEAFSAPRANTAQTRYLYTADGSEKRYV
jgi:hypothetical protein